MESGRKRILIIEDAEEMRSFLIDFFVGEGLETESAGNGHEALRKLVNKPFDLVITDVHLPGLSGLDILPRIKKIQPEVPIIVITDFGNGEIQRKAYERGATVYLEKAIYFRELKELIRKMVFPENKGKGVRNGRCTGCLSW